MSRYYFDKDDLWWQASAFLVVVTVCIVVTWAVVWSSFHPGPPESTLDKARDNFVYGCDSYSGAPNVGSDNPKDWQCIK